MIYNWTCYLPTFLFLLHRLLEIYLGCSLLQTLMYYQYSALLKSARVNYYSNLIDQCQGDSRKLYIFRVVNSLFREPLETALPEHDDPTKLANEFGTFFLKKKKEII